MVRTKKVTFENDSIDVLLPENFRAGSLKQFIDKWEKITSDDSILETVKSCNIDLINESELSHLKPKYPLNFNENERQIIDREVEKLLGKNIIEKCDHSPGEIISSIFIRQKKDKTYRVILNLKEFNNYVEYNHFKMESLQSVLKVMKQGCLMASVDLKDAYYSVPLANDQRKFTRFIWNGELFQYTCLVMGLACSPRKFTKLMKPVFSDLRKYGFINVPYIDDIFLQGDNDNECWNNVKATVHKLQELGFILNIEKSVFVPKHEIMFLGFILNSTSMTVRLPYEKIQTIQNLCRKILNSNETEILLVSQLLGLMVASFPGVDYGPLFYRRLENAKIDGLRLSKGNYKAKMQICTEVKSDLTWWIDNLPIAIKQITHDNPHYVLRTDASSVGWGAECNKNTTGGRWNEQELKLHINEQELMAVLFALQSLCRDLNNVHVQIMSDNTTRVCYINAMGGSRSRTCNDIARKIWFWAIEKNVWLSATHIPGAENQIADKCSRVFDDHTEWMLNVEIFNKITKLWGPFDIDIFASRLNKQLPKYIAWKPDPQAEFIDAFSICWKQIYFYAFPPFSVISRVVQKVQEEKAEGVIVVPMWPTQTWYTSLMELLVDTPRVIRNSPKVLKLPHSEKKYPLKMTLMVCRVCGASSRTKEFREKYCKSLRNRGEDPPENSIQCLLRNGQASVVKGVSICFDLL